MRRVILLLILAGSLFTSVQADIAVADIKQQTNQYIINNTEFYPEYQFLTSSEIWNYEYPSLVVNGTFGGGYKLDGFILHAIKRTYLDPTVLADLSSPEGEKKNLSAYFESTPLATSDLLLPVTTSLNENLSVSNLTVLLNIEGINKKTLIVSKIKTIYQYENGTISEEIEQTKPEKIDSASLNDINQMFSPDILLEKI